MSLAEIDDAIRRTTMFKRLSENDRKVLAEVSTVKRYAKGDCVFGEGDPSDVFSVVVSGRVKIVKMTPAGKDVILEIFGTGDPFGAVAAYEGRPFPASAIAIEDTVCLLTPRRSFFAINEFISSSRSSPRTSHRMRRSCEFFSLLWRRAALSARRAT